MSFLSFLTIVVLGILVYLFVRSYHVEAKPEQLEFKKGNVPEPHPDGFHAGSVPGRIAAPGGWKGKTFAPTEKTGKNVFEKNGVRTEKYPFKTYVTKGVRDPDREVLAIDYNIPGNSFWVKWVLDELVQTAPGKYLGKAHLRILPSIPFTISFFRLEDDTASHA